MIQKPETSHEGHMDLCEQVEPVEPLPVEIVPTKKQLFGEDPNPNERYPTSPGNSSIESWDSMFGCPDCLCTRKHKPGDDCKTGKCNCPYCYGIDCLEAGGCDHCQDNGACIWCDKCKGPYCRNDSSSISSSQSDCKEEQMDVCDQAESITLHSETAVRMAEAAGFNEIEVLGDGSCLYRAIATEIRGTEESHVELRQLVVDEMNESQAEGLYDDIARIDAANPTGWAGPEHMRALCNCLNIAIRVFDGTRSNTWTVQPSMCQAERTVNITFDGVHFNLLRKANEGVEETNTVEKTEAGVVKETVPAMRLCDEHNDIANLLVNMSHTDPSASPKTTSVATYESDSGSMNEYDVKAAALMNQIMADNQARQPAESSQVDDLSQQTTETLKEEEAALTAEGFRKKAIEIGGFTQILKPRNDASGTEDRYFYFPKHLKFLESEQIRSNPNLANAILKNKKHFDSKLVSWASKYNDTGYKKALKQTIRDRKQLRRTQKRKRSKDARDAQLEQMRKEKEQKKEEKAQKKRKEREEKELRDQEKAKKKAREREEKELRDQEKAQKKAQEKELRDQEKERKQRLAEQEEARRRILREFLLSDMTHLPFIRNIFALSTDVREIKLRNMKSDADVDKLNVKCADGKIVHFAAPNDDRDDLDNKGRHVAHLSYNEWTTTYSIRYVNGEVVEVEEKELGTVFEILDATKVPHLLPDDFFEGYADLRTHPLYLKASLAIPMTLEVLGDAGHTRKQLQDILSKPQYSIRNLESSLPERNMLLEELMIDPNWEKNRVDAALIKLALLVHPDRAGSEYTGAMQLLNDFRDLLDQVSE